LINSKSEYSQLFDYINKYKNNNNVKNKIIQLKKKDIINKPLKIDLDDRLKIFFNLKNINSEEIFINTIDNSLKADIISESKYEKSFYTCSDIINCHRKIYYESLNYDILITKIFLEEYKKYIIKTNYRNILLELCNFENAQTIINFDNKIKDIIYAIQKNTMIDFNCDNFLREDIFKLKAIIYNTTKDNNEKIKFIKIISFIGNNFDEFMITDIVISDNDIRLLEKLNILRNSINIKNIPDCDNKSCYKCLHTNFCDIKQVNIEEKIPVKLKSGYTTNIQPKLRNTFLF